MREKRAIAVDGVELDVTNYCRMHQRRIRMTMELVHKHCGRKVVELGSHPWVMTSTMIDNSELEVQATVSAEEVTLWPDDFGFRCTSHTLVTLGGRTRTIKNYSFNVERRLCDLDETPDTVIACEIVEHLVRAPHILFLNVNRWLNPGGTVVVTTPNGSQFMNPFRRKPKMPAFRAHCYERHSYVYRLCDLKELVELCGFEILDCGYWSPYPNTGIRRVTPVLAKLPGSYFSDKFERTVYVVARKSSSVSALSRMPTVYEPSADWEFISPTDERGGGASSCHPESSAA